MLINCINLLNIYFIHTCKGGHESDICGFGGIRDPIHFFRVINDPN